MLISSREISGISSKPCLYILGNYSISADDDDGGDIGFLDEDEVNGIESSAVDDVDGLDNIGTITTDKVDSIESNIVH